MGGGQNGNHKIMVQGIRCLVYAALLALPLKAGV